MKDLLTALRDGVLIADGAMGTMLQREGLGEGECPEQWNVSHRREVQNIHKAYLDAGCDLILTNTFGGNYFKLKRFGLGNRVHEFNIAAVELAKEVIGQRSVYLLGDVGPTGEFMEPVGSFTVQEFYQVFEEQMAALTEGGVDAIIIETMSCLEECLAALRAARRIPGITVIVSMSFNPGGRGFRTMMGVDIPSMVKGLISCGADVIGTNCGGLSVAEMTDAIEQMRALTSKPLVAQPNAGSPKLVQGRTIYEQSSEGMASEIKTLVKAGANIIGGCCGTTPEHMAKIAEAIRKTK